MLSVLSRTFKGAAGLPSVAVDKCPGLNNVEIEARPTLQQSCDAHELDAGEDNEDFLLCGT